MASYPAAPRALPSPFNALRLAKCRAQLVEVDGLLARAPADARLAALKRDVLAALRLAEAVLVAPDADAGYAAVPGAGAHAAAAAAPAAAAAAAAGARPPPPGAYFGEADGGLVKSTWASVTPGSAAQHGLPPSAAFAPVAAAFAAAPASSSSGAPASSLSAAGAGAAPGAPATSSSSFAPAAGAAAGGVVRMAQIEFAESQRCEVKAGERWQAAVVTKRLPGGVYRVRRLHDEEEVEARAGAGELRRMPKGQGLRIDALTPGMKVYARYSEDGVYYPAVVERRTEHGCMATYEGYGNTEHVPVEYVWIGAPPAAVGESAAPASAAGEGAGEVSDEHGTIPRYLVVLPTDSEKVRERKTKQLRSLRRKQKDESITEFREQQKASWQAFQATAKRVKGALTTVGGHSQFSVGEDPEARVGVVRAPEPGASPPPP